MHDKDTFVFPSLCPVLLSLPALSCGPSTAWQLPCTFPMVSYKKICPVPLGNELYMHTVDMAQEQSSHENYS